MKEVICICCPKGCHLQVDEQNDYAVTGNGCPNGIAYGKEELTNPTRIAVKTTLPVPKGMMMDVMKVLDSVVVTSPVKTGQVIVKDICGTGSDIVATRDL